MTREKCDEEDDGFPSWIECALRQEDIAKAEAAIAAGLEKYPRSARLLVYRGIELAKKGEVDSAVQWLQAVARANHASRFNRSQLIYESDRWLIEQAISDEEVRQAAIDALFTPPENNEPEAELVTEEANIPAEGEE